MCRALLIAAAVVLAAPPAATAQASWGGSVSLSSDHLQYGISRSSHDPSLAAELHMLERHGVMASLWAATSRAREVDSTSVDVGATLGIGGLIGRATSWRAAWSHYESPWQSNARWYRYNEFSLDVQMRDVLLVSVRWSPDTTVYYAYSGVVPELDALAYEASVQHQLPAGWRGFGGAGFRDLPGSVGGGYWYGSVGVGWSSRRWQADVSYVYPSDGASEVSWPDTVQRQMLLRLAFVF